MTDTGRTPTMSNDALTHPSDADALTHTLVEAATAGGYTHRRFTTPSRGGGDWPTTPSTFTPNPTRAALSHRPPRAASAPVRLTRADIERPVTDVGRVRQAISQAGPASKPSCTASYG
jgi:hypothetical protein